MLLSEVLPPGDEVTGRFDNAAKVDNADGDSPTAEDAVDAVFRFERRERREFCQAMPGDTVDARDTVAEGGVAPAASTIPPLFPPDVMAVPWSRRASSVGVLPGEISMSSAWRRSVTHKEKNCLNDQLEVLFAFITHCFQPGLPLGTNLF